MSRTLKQRYAVFTLALALGACALFSGGEQPKGPHDALVLAGKQHDALVMSTMTALNVGAITPAQARQAYGLLVTARTALDGVNVALAGCVDPKTGARVAVVPGAVAQIGGAGSPSGPPSIPVAVLQEIACNSATTPEAQLALVNSLLLQLALYYQSKGVTK